MVNMRVVSWNVKRAAKTAGPVADAIKYYRPSLVALQEFNESISGGKILSESLGAAGYVRAGHPARAAPFRTIIFALESVSLEPLPVDLKACDPFWTEVKYRDVGVSAVHIPLQTKTTTALREAHWKSVLFLAKSVGSAKRLIIDDFNTTRHHIDEIGKSVPGDNLLRDLEAASWTEAWRELHHNPALPQYAWQHPTRSQFRLDQAWLSPALQPCLKEVQYDHDVRLERLSDHSMMIVDFDIPE